MREYYDPMGNKASLVIHAPLRGVSLKTNNAFLNFLTSFHNFSIEDPYANLVELITKCSLNHIP